MSRRNSLAEQQMLTRLWVAKIMPSFRTVETIRKEFEETELQKALKDFVGILHELYLSRWPQSVLRTNPCLTCGIPLLRSKSGGIYKYCPIHRKERHSNLMKIMRAKKLRRYPLDMEKGEV